MEGHKMSAKRYENHIGKVHSFHPIHSDTSPTVFGLPSLSLLPLLISSALFCYFLYASDILTPWLSTSDNTVTGSPFFTTAVELATPHPPFFIYLFSLFLSLKSEKEQDRCLFPERLQRENSLQEHVWLITNRDKITSRVSPSC